VTVPGLIHENRLFRCNTSAKASNVFVSALFEKMLLIKKITQLSILTKNYYSACHHYRKLTKKDFRPVLAEIINYKVGAITGLRKSL